MPDRVPEGEREAAMERDSQRFGPVGWRERMVFGWAFKAGYKAAAVSAEAKLAEAERDRNEVKAELRSIREQAYRMAGALPQSWSEDIERAESAERERDEAVDLIERARNPAHDPLDLYGFLRRHGRLADQTTGRNT